MCREREKRTRISTYVLVREWNKQYHFFRTKNENARKNCENCEFVRMIEMRINLMVSFPSSKNRLVHKS